MTTAKKTEESKTEIVKDEKNGIVRPGPDTATGKVWAIADTLQASATEENPVTRAAVIKLAEAKGINVSTAATQYGRWRTYNGLAKETTAKPAKEKAPKAPKAAAKAVVPKEANATEATLEAADAQATEAAAEPAKAGFTL